MNLKAVRFTLGTLLVVLGISMVPSLGWSLYYGETDTFAFLLSIAITILFGFAVRIGSTPSKELGFKDGFLIVALGWMLAGVFGALPFVFSGAVESFTDGLFEAISGFTTTGSTIIDNVEILPRGILFWRSFTHWLGGMGIIVLFLALLPGVGAGGIQMFRAEVPGPSVEKLSSRITSNAKALWSIYVGLTMLQTLLLMVAGFDLFDALVHSFGTLATGGFSTKNLSVGAYNNPAAEIIITIFMFLGGVNFSLYYYLLKGQRKRAFGDEEFRFYLSVTVIATILIAVNIRSMIPSFFDLIRTSAFQVVSIMTTTGYATANFDLWPGFSKLLLLLLMFFGGSAGSTGGAIKQIRMLVMLKYSSKQIIRTLHPKAVVPVKIGGRVIPEETLRGIIGFIFLYMTVFIVGAFFMSFIGLDMITAISAVASSLGNIGPGLGAVGPTFTYSGVPRVGKLVLTFLMLMGRLELYTVILCFMPGFWDGVKIGGRPPQTTIQG